jgi:putative DNA primase/helicase
MRARLERAAGLPLNDYGNGQRFVVHFGEDVMRVPRVGWFTWTGRVWRLDPDDLAVRRQAQRLSDLIRREIPHLAPGRAEAEALKVQG